MLRAFDVGVFIMADIGVVDLDDPKCKFSRIDYGVRLSLHKIGDCKFVVTDVLTGCVTIPLEGELELVTAEDMATVIDIHTHEMTGLTQNTPKKSGGVSLGDGAASMACIQELQPQALVRKRPFAPHLC